MYETRIFITAFTTPVTDPLPEPDESSLHPPVLRGDRKVAQPEALYLVLAMNECSEVEVVDVYVGMSGCERASTAHVISVISAVVTSKPCVCRRDFYTNAARFYCLTLSSDSFLI